MSREGTQARRHAPPSHWQARRVPPVVRRAATVSIDAKGDDVLRALVRILARQAAREAFESELQRNAAIVH